MVLHHVFVTIYFIDGIRQTQRHCFRKEADARQFIEKTRTQKLMFCESSRMVRYFVEVNGEVVAHCLNMEVTREDAEA